MLLKGEQLAAHLERELRRLAPNLSIMDTI